MAAAEPEASRQDTFRERARRLFRAQYESSGFDRPGEYASLTEQGIFDAHPFSDRDCATDDGLRRTSYFHRCSHVLAHLCPRSYVRNPTLQERLRSNAGLARSLGSMSPDDLHPEHWAPIKARIALESSQEDVCITTDAFRCRMCKERKCTYVQVQTRSADEPITTFVSCTNCGFGWRE
jgi:transcription elongation factor S-II